MTDSTQTTNTPEHDARLAREDAIAEEGRQERAASAAAKKSKPAAKAKAPAKQMSMAEFVDGLLMAGITWTNLEARAKTEGARRKITTLSTLGALKAHVKYRSGQKQWKVTQTKDTVKMEKVEQAAKAKAKSKPAAKAKVLKLTSPAKMGAARKTGKAVVEEGRQTVTEPTEAS